ncbi:hypothetical protein SUGI_0874390 [Cryptomeria japonica]|nr:hypothetical protein SUGI_0874390 [Cryptomeria japonica]
MGVSSNGLDFKHAFFDFQKRHIKGSGRQARDSSIEDLGDGDKGGDDDGGGMGILACDHFFPHCRAYLGSLDGVFLRGTVGCAGVAPRKGFPLLMSHMEKFLLFFYLGFWLGGVLFEIPSFPPGVFLQGSPLVAPWWRLGVHFLSLFGLRRIWWRGSIFYWLYLLASPSPCDEVFVVPSQLTFWVVFFVLHVMHLWASLVFPMEVVMSSIEGEMDVARFGPSPFEVELDAIKSAWVMFGKLIFSLMDMVLGTIPISIVLVLPSKVEFLVGDGTGVYPSPIEVELGVAVDARMYWQGGC